MNALRVRDRVTPLRPVELLFRPPYLPLGIFLRLLNTLGLLARVPEGALTAGIKGKPVPQELTREPVRVRIAVYKGGRLLAAHGISAEGDYNTSVLATVLFVQRLLAEGGAGLPKGLHAIEDLMRLTDLKAELESRQVFVRPLAA